ncbi:MAG TPA: hypothetical protein PKA49_12340 [Tepidiformaceae bacterium]|nr:hypothetical protein [Tepidiformaceae bacterium]
MRHFTVLLTLICALLAAAVPVARADSLLVDAPGARNLSGGGGYLAWSAPSAGRWQLPIRRPNGTTFVPKIATFGSPAQPSLGTSGGARGGGAGGARATAARPRGPVDR